MNNFADYARSSAFRIDLSTRMIETLDDVQVKHVGRRNKRLNMAPYFALQRRGLIEWIEKDGEKNGPFITKAGAVVHELLTLAGYFDGEDA